MKTKDLDSAALKAAIEASLRVRLEAFGLKLNSAAAKKEEAAFISGAMCAINALLPNEAPEKISAAIPPMWIIGPMTGRSVLEKL